MDGVVLTEIEKVVLQNFLSKNWAAFIAHASECGLDESSCDSIYKYIEEVDV